MSGFDIWEETAYTEIGGIEAMLYRGIAMHRSAQG